MFDLKNAVEILSNDGFEAHRGVIHLRDGDYLIFGNDGYAQDPRAQREVERVRESIAGRADELGFEVDEHEGYSWAMLVRFHDGFATPGGQEMCRNLLTLAQWQGWTGDESSTIGQFFEGYQSKIAETTIRRIRGQVLRALGRAPDRKDSGLSPGRRGREDGRQATPGRGARRQTGPRPRRRPKD